MLDRRADPLVRIAGRVVGQVLALVDEALRDEVRIRDPRDRLETEVRTNAGGIFFVGLEQNGMIYGYALDHVGGSFTRVATIQSGNPSIMDLNFDRDVGYLWAVCDNTCAGRTNVLDIDTRASSPTKGKFYIRQGFERPSTMPDTNNEGFTVTPESTCQGGFKSVFYSDDNNLNLHAIRRDSIPCGAFLL